MSQDLLGDLEEGEIPDDVVDDTSQAQENVKELPRRYILHENKGLHHRHKKSCKHSGYNYAKLKKNPVKLRQGHKKHKTGCRHAVEKLAKHTTKNVNPVKIKSTHVSDVKSGITFNSHSLYAEMKNNFKNCPTPPLKIFKQNSLQSEKYESHPSDIGDIPSGTNTSEQLSGYEKYQVGSVLDESNEAVNNNKKLVLDNPLDNCEDSEDEEELRKKALATCIKRIMPEGINETVSKETSCLETKTDYVFPPQPLSNKLLCDNYEIVDMEVDEENENLVSVTDDKLYFIDHTPSYELENINENTASALTDKSCSSTTDNEIALDEEILRAEAFASMQRKDTSQLESDEGRSDVDNDKIEEGILSEVAPCSSVIKSPISEKSVANSQEVKMTNNNSDTLNKPQKSFIIRLTNESTDESEEDEKFDSSRVPENAFASLEALISDARNKSNENSKVNINNGHVPEAVSCLSKAQQEEYHSLMKILAKKSVNFPEIKPPTAPSLISHLKLSERKFVKASASLLNVKMLLNTVTQEFYKAKSDYIKSKLKVKNLKEQLVAAEKIARSNLSFLSKTSSHLKTVELSVKKYELLVNKFHDECLKYGFSVKGQNYILPSVSNVLASKNNKMSD